MGRFYDMFYKRGEVDDAVRVTLPPGIRTPEGYGALLSVDYAACEQTKCRSMASLPFAVVQEGRSGTRNLGNHPLAKLLNGMANEDMSVVDLMNWTVLRRDTFGTAYWYIEWHKGKPVAIWPVTASVMHDFKRDGPGGYRSRYQVAGGDKYVPAGVYFPDEIVAIKTHITKDGVKGKSLAKVAAEEIGLSIDLERFYRNMLKNGNHHLGHVEIGEGRMSPEELAALKQAVKNKAGIDATGEAPIFGHGAKWVADQQTMKDASVIEQQKWVLQQVCRACNVPPWKVYDSDQATYNGGQQIRIDYVTDTILPEVRQIELALQPVLDSCGYRNCRAKFRLHGLMRGDDTTRTQYYRELGYLGALRRSDVRELEDLEPIQGIDKPLFPLNYGTANEDGTVNVFSSNVGGTGDGTQEGATNVPNQE